MLYGLKSGQHQGAYGGWGRTSGTKLRDVPAHSARAGRGGRRARSTRRGVRSARAGPTRPGSASLAETAPRHAAANSCATRVGAASWFRRDALVGLQAGRCRRRGGARRRHEHRQAAAKVLEVCVVSFHTSPRREQEERASTHGTGPRVAIEAVRSSRIPRRAGRPSPRRSSCGSARSARPRRRTARTAATPLLPQHRHGGRAAASRVCDCDQQWPVPPRDASPGWSTATRRAPAEPVPMSARGCDGSGAAHLRRRSARAALAPSSLVHRSPSAAARRSAGRATMLGVDDLARAHVRPSAGAAAVWSFAAASERGSTRPCAATTVTTRSSRGRSLLQAVDVRS
jgi:hypothetical protein